MGTTKYEHKYGFWFIFGESIDGKTVDISDGDDVLTNVKRNEAERVIKQHNDMVQELDDFNSKEQDGKE
jgi:hypothetical protein